MPLPYFKDLSDLAATESPTLQQLLQFVPTAWDTSGVTRTAPVFPHTPKAVTYHEQSHYCRSMIGHSLGRNYPIHDRSQPWAYGYSLFSYHISVYMG